MARLAGCVARPDNPLHASIHPGLPPGPGTQHGSLRDPSTGSPEVHPHRDAGARAATRSALRYDYDYPDIGYGEQANQNAVARLQARLDRGEAKLAFDPTRGYLDSVLKELAIDASSQTLVYSKTSLQIDLIRAATPRAIYFNDDTYVAWVPHTTSIEIVTMDSLRQPSGLREGIYLRTSRRHPERSR